MKLTIKTLTLTLLSLTLCSCANDHLAFTTFTKVGLDISAAESTPTSAMFGYKRFEGALIPVDPKDTDIDPGDVHSVYAAIDLNNQWLGGIDIKQVFATGEAAVNAAKNPQPLTQALENE